jgi:hypothetical protein
VAPTYQGGSVLTSVDVVAVFAGGNTASGTSQNWHSLVDGSILSEVCLLDGFLGDLTDSAYVDGLGQEYSNGGGSPAIYRGTFIGSFFETLPGTVSNNVSDDINIQKMLGSAIDNNQLPFPGPGTVYFVFTQFDIRWRGQGLLGLSRSLSIPKRK